MSRLVIHGSDVAALVAVANGATESEIVIGSFAPVFNRDHVVDLVLGKCKSLGNTAIFAAAGGA